MVFRAWRQVGGRYRALTVMEQCIWPCCGFNGLQLGVINNSMYQATAQRDGGVMRMSASNGGMQLSNKVFSAHRILQPRSLHRQRSICPHRRSLLSGSSYVSSRYSA